jgi:hypothetical protein
MKYLYIISIVIASMWMVGCGGGGTNLKGQVSGVVFDADGNVVRGATVWANGTNHETVTNSDGLYVLETVPAEDILIRTSITRDGVKFVGSNLARVFENERAKNVNIVLVRENQSASVKGIVYDNQGHALEGARVFALVGTGSIYSSSMDITGSDGSYVIRNLVPGVDYSLVASGLGYQSDTDTVNLDAGYQDTVLFTLGNALDILMPVPQNISAVAWTTPKELSRSPKALSAYEAIKNMIDPKRAGKKTTTRNSLNGNWVEVDLYWDAITNSNLHGFGIYRANDAFSTTTGIDFLRDPQASFYSDLDDHLLEGATYSYQVTSWNTADTGSANEESAKSDRYTVNTLGDLELDGTSQGPLTFYWLAANGATTYTVYLFSEYPSFGIDSIWQSSGTAGTSMVYSGPSLSSGHRYYYLILGSDGVDGRTLSAIGEFVKN